jgi:hypothetical protein
MNQNQMYEQKYLKYKQKYLELKSELSGGILGIKNPFAAKDYDKSKPEIVEAEAKVAKYKKVLPVIKVRDNAQTDFENKSKASETATKALEAAKAALDAAQTKLNEVYAENGISEVVPGQAGGGVWNWNPFAPVGAEYKKYSAELTAAEAELTKQINISAEEKKLEKLRNKKGGEPNNYW